MKAIWKVLVPVLLLALLLIGGSLLYRNLAPGALPSTAPEEESNATTRRRTSAFWTRKGIWSLCPNISEHLL